MFDYFFFFSFMFFSSFIRSCSRLNVHWCVTATTTASTPYAPTTTTVTRARRGPDTGILFLRTIHYIFEISRSFDHVSSERNATPSSDLHTPRGYLHVLHYIIRTAGFRIYRYARDISICPHHLRSPDIILCTIWSPALVYSAENITRKIKSFYHSVTFWYFSD